MENKSTIGDVLDQMISVGKAVARVEGKQDSTSEDIGDLKERIDRYGENSRKRFESFQQAMCIPHDGELKRHDAKMEALGGRIDVLHKKTNGKKLKDYAITIGSASGTVGFLLLARWICITFFGFDPFPFAGR